MKRDWQRIIIDLRWPLIVLGLALCFGGAMVMASDYVKERKAESYQQVQNRLRAAQLALSNTEREGANLASYRVRYENLAARGVFGQEQRLAWVEFMTNLNAGGHLTSLSYEVATQRPVTGAAFQQAASIEMLASRIQLKMGFMHEGDLVQTLDQLRRSSAGFYRMEGCTIKRKQADREITVGENITADCRLEWITMRPNPNKK